MSTQPQCFYILLAGSIYEAYVHEAGTKKCPAKLPSQNLAIILPRNIWSNPQKCTGVLVTFHTNVQRPKGVQGFLGSVSTSISDVVREYRDKERMFARHEALIQFYSVSGEDVDLAPCLVAYPIAWCKNSSDSRNNRWRIG